MDQHPDHTPLIDGWTVYRAQEWWEAICDADPSLVVRHAVPAVLEAACEAINRPRPRISSVQGPLGGLNV